MTNIVNNHPEQTLAALLESDPVLKASGLPQQWNKVADEATLLRTIEELKKRHHKVIVVNTRAEAFETVKTLIPAGASVSNGHSTTLVYHLEHISVCL